MRWVTPLAGAVMFATPAVASEGGMPQLDPSAFMPQLIWLAITFIALYFIMTKLALPRIGGAIEQRRSKIADDLDAAQNLKHETEKAIAAYEAALADARAKAHAIAQETRDALSAEVEAERVKTEADLAEKLAGAEKTINDSKAKALGEVQAVATSLAGHIVSELTGVKVTRPEISKAVSSLAK